MRQRPRHERVTPAAGVRWVTLSNRRRVLLDEGGRVRQGLPGMFHGVHVQDVSALGKQVRDIEREAAECEQSVGGRRAQTFRTTEQAVRSLLRANPDLVTFLEQECGRRSCDDYRTWVRRGRRGPKPRATHDGRFDQIEVPLDLRGSRKLSSWLEAVYVTVPPSRRWDDFPERLQLLADATGLTLQLPEEAHVLVVEHSDAERCQATADERVDALIALARQQRLPGAGAQGDGDVPF
jgi:hypothetical protein